MSRVIGRESSPGTFGRREVRSPVNSYSGPSEADEVGITSVLRTTSLGILCLPRVCFFPQPSTEIFPIPVTCDLYSQSAKGSH